MTPQLVLVDCKTSWVGKSKISFLIDTGGGGAPLVTLRGNGGFPESATVYAIATTRPSGINPQPYGCIEVTLVFASPIPASATQISLNVWQADAKEVTYPPGF